MRDTVTTAHQRATIVNRKGLHARAAAKLSRLAAEYESKITVTREGESADARSIMDLLMLVAHMDSDVEIHAEGLDAAEAVTAIASLIADGFGEQGDADSVC